MILNYNLVFLYEYKIILVKKIRCVDQNSNCVRFINKTSKELNFNLKVTKSSAVKYLLSCLEQFDIIFFDPPYEFKIEEYFKGNAKVTKIGGHGQKEDALKGIDLIVNLGGILHTSQVKPFSSFVKTEEIIEMLDTGNVKHYSVDWLIFINPKTNNVMIFENKPISEKNQYVFKLESLLYEIK